MMLLNSAQQWLLVLGIFLGFTGVAGGAFGAHALKQRLAQEMLAIFEVGIRYQMYHAFAICLGSWLVGVTTGSWAWWGGISFFIGTVVFSGSLYVLALSGVRWWGAITPIGGVLLLVGWLLLAVAVIKR